MAMERPEGLTDAGVDWAMMNQGQSVYVQGFCNGEIGVWLRIGTESSTLIGYGKPILAMAEATITLIGLIHDARQGVKDWVKRHPDA